MARKTFKEGFKEEAVAYCKKNSDKTIKECANDLDLGYSTLRRWISQVEAGTEKKTMPKKMPTQKKNTKDVVENQKVEEKLSVNEEPKSTTNEKDTYQEKERIVEEASIQHQSESTATYIDEEPSINYIPEQYQVKKNFAQKVLSSAFAKMPTLDKITQQIELISLYKKRLILKIEQKRIKKAIKNKIK